MKPDLSIFTRGAQLLGQLQQLQPGQASRISRQALSDIVVPAHPLDRQTAEYLVEWFRVRLPFFTMVREEPIRGFWDFYRPLPEELERLMALESGRNKI